MKLALYFLYHLSLYTRIKANFKDIFNDIFEDMLLTPLVTPQGSQPNVHLYLFTRKNPSNPIVLSMDNANLLNDGKIVKMVIHGFQNHGFMKWVNSTREAYLKKGDYNVVQVDWSALSYQLYFRTARNTFLVGAAIANATLASKVPLDNIHLIGHSLGAQVAGVVGRLIFENTNRKIGRISALDPAGVLFEHIAERYVPVSKTAAKMVDVIHTDSRKFGMLSPVGTVDFYPNGGHAAQPGCLLFSFSWFLTLFDKSVKIVGCSHWKSIIYFLESINSKGFIATECSNYPFYLLKLCGLNKKVVMGEYTPSTVSGVYYLETNPIPPYALG